MQLIIELLELGKAILDLMFAIPILGILILAGTFGPMIVRAIRRR